MNVIERICVSAATELSVPRYVQTGVLGVLV